MTTDWQAIVFVAVMVTSVAAGCVVVSRLADRRMERIKLRFAADPQCSRPVDEIGVERKPLLPAAPSDVVALPRSPQAPAAGDPRPSAAGPQLPAGLRRQQHPAAPAGVQRRRVILHGW